MCELATIATIASAAATAAGTGMSIMQNQAMADAQNQANREAAERSSRLRRDEMNRQDEYEKRAISAYEAHLGQMAPGSTLGMQGDQTREVLGDQATVAAPMSVALPGQEGADDRVTSDIARGIARGTQDANRRVAALAKMAGVQGQGVLSSAFDGVFGADQRLAASRANSSGRLYGAESAMPQPTVRAGSMGGLGQALTGIGGAGLRASMGGAFGNGYAPGTNVPAKQALGL